MISGKDVKIMKPHKDQAVDFLHLIVSGKIDEAYKKYVSPDFRHHNPYFPGMRIRLSKRWKRMTVSAQTKRSKWSRRLKREKTWWFIPTSNRRGGPRGSGCPYFQFSWRQDCWNVGCWPTGAERFTKRKWDVLMASLFNIQPETASRYWTCTWWRRCFLNLCISGYSALSNGENILTRYHRIHQRTDFWN